MSLETLGNLSSDTFSASFPEWKCCQGLQTPIQPENRAKFSLCHCSYAVPWSWANHITVYSEVGFPCGSAGKESTCNVGNLISIPGLGRSPGEGNSYPLHDSGLKNSMDSIVHGVAKSRTRLSNFGLPWVAQMAKHLPIMQETQVLSLGWEDPLEKEMASHSNTLA